jgi:hypothetical protein
MLASVDAPVLLIVFNRPEKTRRMFDWARATAPTAPRRLFIAADRPRPDERSIGEMWRGAGRLTSGLAERAERRPREPAWIRNIATKPRERS